MCIVFIILCYNSCGFIQPFYSKVDLLSNSIHSSTQQRTGRTVPPMCVCTVSVPVYVIMVSVCIFISIGFKSGNEYPSVFYLPWLIYIISLSNYLNESNWSYSHCPLASMFYYGHTVHSPLKGKYSIWGNVGLFAYF